MYHDMLILGNFHGSWFVNPIFLKFGRIFFVTWAPLGMDGLTSGYLTLLMIFTLEASSFLERIYPINMVTELDHNASTSWVA